MKKVILLFFTCIMFAAVADACGISTQPSTSSQTVCSGGTITALTVAASGSNLAYQWYSNTTASNSGGATLSGGGATSNTYTPSNTLVGTTYYYCVVTSSSCATATSNVSGGITVNAKPSLSAQSAPAICTGSSFNYTPTGAIIPAGTTYAWNAPSGGASGGVSASGSTVTGILTNSGATAITEVYSVTPTAGSCPGTAFNVSVTVNPEPSIASQSAPAICTGGNINFTPTGTIPSGTTYAWNAPSGGATGGASGSGSALSGSLTNAGSTAVTEVYSLTPTAGACIGSAFNVSVTVNPTPVISAQTIPAICTGGSFNYNPAGGTIPSGTTYAWSAPSGGAAGGASGSGSTVTGALINSGATAITEVYSVTPTAGSCSGTAFNVSVTVNPKPTIAAQSTPAICTGGSFNYTPTGTIPSGTAYAWNAPTGGASGGASGSGATVTGTLTNGTSSSITEVYSVTPTAGSCPGSAFNLSVTVDPIPAISAQSAPSTCSGISFSYTPTGGVIPSGTTYSWNAPSGGATGGASGSGSAVVSGTLSNVTTSAITEVYSVTPAAGNCTGSPFNVSVTINPVPVETLVIDSTHTCHTGNNFSFSVTPGAVYNSFVWSFSNSLGHANDVTTVPNDNNVYFTTTGFARTISVLMTTPAGCTSSQSGGFNVYPMPDSSFTIQAALCGDSSFNFAQTNTVNTSASTILWGDGANGPGPTASHVYPITASTGTYTVTFIPKNLYGCVDTNRATVTVFPLPHSIFTEDTTSHHCRIGNSFQFTDNSASANYTLSTWNYTFGDGNSSGSQNPLHSYTLANNTTTTFHVTETISTTHGCWDSSSHDLNVYANPIQVIGDSSGHTHGRADTLCGTTSIMLWDQVSSGTTPYTSYRWYDNHGDTLVRLDTLYLPAMNADTSVNYSVLVIDHEGCTNVISKTLQYFPNPNSSQISGDDTVCSGSQNLQYHIATPQNNVHYVWDVTGIPNQVIGRDSLAEVTFPASGYSSTQILAYATNTPYHCTIIDTHSVTISAQTAPTGTMLLSVSPTNTDSILICSNSDVTAYQWGYDNYSTLQPTTISNETQQSLILGAPLPGTGSVYYWVLIGSGDCVSKIYLYGNAPTAITQVSGGDIQITAYPNPFSQVLRLSVSDDQAREWTVEVYDLTGRKVYTQQTMLDKNAMLDIPSAQWASGPYTLRMHTISGENAVLKLIKD